MITNNTRVSLKDVSRVYRKDSSRIYGVDGVNLLINYGEIFALLGPNGAGKTTLINLICGFLKPDSGVVQIDNSDMRSNDNNSILKIRRKIGYVSELPGFYNKITGFEYLNFIGKLYGIKNEILTERINQFADYFELSEHYNQFIYNSSLGTQKKIAIIAALINNPNILILDEPTNSLDPKMISKLKDLLMNFRKEENTIIIATHLLDFAEILSDRVGIINNGNITSILERSEFANNVVQGSKTKLEEYYLSEIK